MNGGPADRWGFFYAQVPPSMRRLKVFLKDEAGGTPIEYAIIAVAVAINVITVVHGVVDRR